MRRIVPPVLHRSLLLLCSALVLGCEIPTRLPEVVAASKYIDYATWADTTTLCMDDRLAVWDRYIEQTSAFLGTDPPAGRIRYTWVPEAQQDESTWPCSLSGVGGCTRLADSEYQSQVFAGKAEMLHELVHAVETPAFGRAHKVFGEGMAEYLSEFAPTVGTALDFSAAFIDMVDRDRLTGDDYPIAMHFVGSLLERDGREKYQAFRALVRTDGKFGDFVAAYEQVYGEDLSAALAAMSGPLKGQGPWLCDGSIGPRITIDGSKTLLLAGECGDGEFFNPGTAEGELGASKVFMLDVAVSGYYEMTLRGSGAPSMPYPLRITSCPGTPPENTSASTEQNNAAALWEGGSYRLQVWYPGGREGAAMLELKYGGPLP